MNDLFLFCVIVDFEVRIFLGFFWRWIFGFGVLYGNYFCFFNNFILIFLNSFIGYGYFLNISIFLGLGVIR